MIVLKLGGSLIHRAKMLVEEVIGYSKESNQTILIVPGGSIFADTVRSVKASQEASHWMAVLAMEQFGYYLADGTNARLTDGISIDEGVSTFLPYAFMKRKDELPHTWDVTSDTIAAWVALQLNARFIKVTDVDGIYLDGVLRKEVDASELMGIETCVDAELPRFLMKNKMNCEIVNGNCAGRLIGAFKGSVPGTLIKG